MTKEIQATTLLSIAAGGVGLPDVSFSALHEAIEHLVGEPVWTHQLASKEPWAKAREALLAQYPTFANVDGDALRGACKDQEREEATIRANAWVEAELVTIGAANFMVTKGNGRDPAIAQTDAITSLRKIACDQEVIVLTPSAETTR